MNATRLHRRDFPAAYLWRWHLAAARLHAAQTAAAERRLVRVMARVERKAR